MYKPEQSRGYDFLAACFSSDGRLLACFPVLTIKEFNKWADENPMYTCRLYQAKSFDITSKFDAKQTSIFDAIGGHIMEYTYIKKVGNYVIDVFHAPEFDYNFVRKLLDRDAKSIVEVYTRTNADHPLSILFVCSLI